MIKAVIDTNVLVSAFWTGNRLSPTVRIANAIAHDGFTPVYSPEMISEYREVLSRTKFNFSADEVNALVNHIVAKGAGCPRLPGNRPGPKRPQNRLRSDEEVSGVFAVSVKAF